MSKNTICGYTAARWLCWYSPTSVYRSDGQKVFKPWLNKQMVLCSVLWQEWDTLHPTNEESRYNRQCTGT